MLLQKRFLIIYYLPGLIVDIWPGKPSLLDESLNLENSKSSKNELLDNRYPLVQVYFVDEGNLEWKYLSEVRMLPIEALQLPKLAIKATLSDIVPEPSKTKAAMQKFDQLCKAKQLCMSIDAKVDAQQVRTRTSFKIWTEHSMNLQFTSKG